MALGVLVARVRMMAVRHVQVVGQVSLLPAVHAAGFELRSLEPVTAFREDTHRSLLARLMPTFGRLPERHVRFLISRSPIRPDALPFGVPVVGRLLVPIQERCTATRGRTLLLDPDLVVI